VAKRSFLRLISYQEQFGMRVMSFARHTTNFFYPSHLKPFEYNISLRSPDAEHLVQSVYSEHSPKEPSKL
jgi:hypothetical protein